MGWLLVAMFVIALLAGEMHFALGLAVGWLCAVFDGPSGGSPATVHRTNPGFPYV